MVDINGSSKGEVYKLSRITNSEALKLPDGNVGIMLTDQNLSANQRFSKLEEDMMDLGGKYDALERKHGALERKHDALQLDHQTTKKRLEVILY